MGEKQEILQVIEEKRLELEAISDGIWDHPETGYRESFAAGSLCGFLEKNGFTVERGLAGIETAFCGSFGSGRPVIGLLGEFDALAMLSQEAEGLEQKAVVCEGAGHGCGHNLLGTGSLAAALAVKEYLERGHEGTVRFYGCPAEEGGAGKVFMAKAGVFDCLDAAFTWHPGDTNQVCDGSNLANYQVCYHFKGKSSHAAMAPEMGRSALDAVELMNVGVQFLREHVPQECRIHYAITNSGGTAPGTVQADADVLYLMRAPQFSTAMEVYDRVNEIARGAAMMTGTEVQAEFIKATSNLLSNQTLERLMQKNLEAIGSAVYDEADRRLAESLCATIEHRGTYFETLLSELTDPIEYERLKQYLGQPIYDVVLPYTGKGKLSFASSDVGDVSWICPLAQISMATMPAGAALHSWQVVSVGKSPLAKKGMLQAGKVMAASAVDLFENPAILEAAREEKNRRTGGRPYVSPIPDGVKPKL